ncbi:helix-turn-helix transcriptional regulator [Salmonella enterica subsp. enterica serovar Braenderup]|uniref:helix-turn-helix transcriptional regulator n=1 Tax=Salmonella enterica TaxID=28901 RepID=UPI0012E559F9|nr:AraC family transcriptional regulator [Salmonella enterica subsp. enterica serovar Pomona]ECB7912788.1 AraC family transcriptional regulator [Salmonella enterica subsp. enterica serovar Minnesota]EHJ9903503.1 helix-turn-helix transcriptional regulator [Salmonella enterica subsp. enterica serovar Adelaide]EHL6684819.1 helix-turn-helix transcriptional regulator [Salmonella enterica]EJD8841915.1 helix-turn-helix transcriptional regulator [Salmonella enterica]
MEDIFINKINIKVNLYQYTIVYAKNSVITLNDSGRNETVTIPKGNIALLERGLKVYLNINKFSDDSPYEIISLTNDKLQNVIKIFDPFNSVGIDKGKIHRGLHDKVFIINDEGINRLLFDEIRFRIEDDDNKYIYELACLLSRVTNLQSLYKSLYVSASNFFTDKIRKIIEKDLSKKWRLSAISEELNISEVAIRKKLDSEGINFNQVLLDARMQTAVRLILNGEYHINKISSLIGMSSTSYFIKIFSSYYGATPKQFYLYHKNKK